MKTITIDGHSLSVSDITNVAIHHYKVEIAKECYEVVAKSRQTLFDLAAKGEPVYGLNRGVGWNKDKEFDEEFFADYNKNLLESHSAGLPPYHSVDEIRAIMLIRLNKILYGSTGISIEIANMYLEFLNRGIHPMIPKRGSIGAADISTLPHIGLAFIGEWKVEYKGEVVPSKVALDSEGLKVAILGPKDGLSITSSNAQGEAMAWKVIKEVEDLVYQSNLIYSLSLEGLNAVIQSLDPRVNAKRRLKGQIQSAAQCLEFLEGSYLFDEDDERALQDPLSFRGGATYTGSLLDGVRYAKELLETQINASDDNPSIIWEEGVVLVSSNFETTSLSTAIEMLGILLSHISKSSCHRMIKLSDPTFTKLSRFLMAEDAVVGFGTLQITFSHLDSEIRYLANPSSMDMFGLAGTIEDHSSNLPIATDKVLKIVDNLQYIIAIEAIHATQAIDLRGVTKLGKETARAYSMLRNSCAFIDCDRNFTIDIENVYELINSKSLIKGDE